MVAAWWVMIKYMILADEALTEYSLFCTMAAYGQRKNTVISILIDKGRYQLFKVYRDSEDMDETIQRPLYEFEDWIEYALVYGKGAIMFHEVRQEWR